MFVLVAMVPIPTQRMACCHVYHVDPVHMVMVQHNVINALTQRTVLVMVMVTVKTVPRVHTPMD
jgi:hypothetical protein